MYLVVQKAILFHIINSLNLFVAMTFVLTISQINDLYCFMIN